MTHLFTRILGFVLFSLSLSPLAAFAQNTGGVFPPGFGDDHQSVQFRASYNADNESFASRVHYQESIDDRLLWRIVGQTRETDDSNVDFDFVQAELFWKLSKTDKPYQTGLRFDARLRDNDRPGQVGVNWMHQWKLNDGWQARVVGLSSLQIGENKNDGVSLAFRTQLSRKLNDGPTIGVQTYNSVGGTEDFSLTKFGHTAGPFVATKIGPVDVVGRVLLGLSDSAPDTDIGVWIGKSF